MTYTFKKKEKLIKQIEKIKDINYLEKISLIIQNNNPDQPLNINESGTSLYFENLSDKTYMEIEKVIKEYKNNIKKNRKNKYKKTKLSDIVDIEEYKKMEELKKYTNSEVTILKRREFDDATSQTDRNKLIMSDQEFNNIRESESNK